MSTQKRAYRQTSRAQSQEATRARITAAAAALHEEVGVARTTVADIARRAGVSRLTVYNHFPDLASLLPACSAHYLAANPMPDLAAALAEPDARRRLREVLVALYGWYRANERMQMYISSDRAIVADLERFMAATSDPVMAELADALAAGLDERARPLAALALDFWSWRRLKAEGLDDKAAGELMSRIVSTAAA